MFIQQQKIGLEPARHQERESLSLPAGQTADGISQPVFKSHVQGPDTVPQLALELLIQRPSEPARLATLCCKRQVLSDGHRGRGATERILKDASNQGCPFVLGPFGDVMSTQVYLPTVRNKRACNGIQ